MKKVKQRDDQDVHLMVKGPTHNNTVLLRTFKYKNLRITAIALVTSRHKMISLINLVITLATTPFRPKHRMLTRFFAHNMQGPLYDCSGYEFQNHLYSNYGPIIKLNGVLGRQPIIFLFDAESSAQILRGENWLPTRPGFQTLDYYRKHYSKTKRDPNKPTGLANDQGEKWKELRSIVNPIMLQPKIVTQYSTVIDEVAQDVINRFKSIRNRKNMIEKFDEEVKLWALESIGVVALGCRLHCFNPELPENSPARRFINIINEFFEVVDKLDFKPSLWRYISTPTFKRAMKMYEEEEELVEHFIHKAKQNINPHEEKINDDRSILENLLAIDERIAVMMAGDLIFGGVDTVANSMLSILYLLAKSPDKQNKLREHLTQDNEQKSYLKAVIKESMRISPVAMGNIRVTSKEYNVLGYNIPKNMQVSFGHQLLSLMENQFPRPTDFIPERWLVDKDDVLFHKNAHTFAFSPFGFGARSCIGRRIAELEMETFLGKFIENFHVEWLGSAPKYRFSTLNFMSPPYNFVLQNINK